MSKKRKVGHTEFGKRVLKEKMVMGSLWVCYKPNWYLYNYSKDWRGIIKSTEPRHIKVVHKSIISSYQQEEAITPNHALFMTGFCAGIYEFTYRLERVRMREEFVYKFADEWTRV